MHHVICQLLHLSWHTRLVRHVHRTRQCAYSPHLAFGFPHTICMLLCKNTHVSELPTSDRVPVTRMKAKCGISLEAHHDQPQRSGAHIWQPVSDKSKHHNQTYVLAVMTHLPDVPLLQIQGVDERGSLRNEARN